MNEDKFNQPSLCNDESEGVSSASSSSAKEETIEHATICPQCKAANSPAMEFCNNCGYKFVEKKQHTVSVKTVVKKYKWQLIAIAVVLALVIIIIVPIYHTRIQPMWMESVNIGDSQETVKSKMGNPASETKGWTYYKGVKNEDEALSAQASGKEYAEFFIEFDIEKRVIKTSYSAKVNKIVQADKKATSVEWDRKEFFADESASTVEQLIRYKDGSFTKSVASVQYDKEKYRTQTIDVEGITMSIKVRASDSGSIKGYVSISISDLDNKTHVQAKKNKYYSGIEKVLATDGVDYNVGKKKLTRGETIEYFRTNKVKKNMSISSTRTIAGVTIDKDGTLLSYDCKDATSITLPASVKNIGSSAFKNAGKLEVIILPEGLESIGKYAFAGVRALRSINIPSSVTNISSSAFEECTLLTIYAAAKSKPSGWDSYWNSSYRPVVWGCLGGGETAQLKYIYNSAGEITITGYIGSQKTIDIPSSIDGKTVKHIAARAFYGCTSLTRVTIPSVTSIGEQAFNGCTSLTSITIPESVTSIGEQAFNGCTSLTIYAAATSEPSGWHYRWNTSNRLVMWGFVGGGETAQLKYLYNSAGEITITGYIGRPTSINIPSSIDGKTVKYITERAFNGCTSLTRVTIPSSVTNIGYNAFYNCTSLTIYAAAKSKPSGWDSYWNSSDRPVRWGIRAK